VVELKRFSTESLAEIIIQSGGQFDDKVLNDGIFPKICPVERVGRPNRKELKDFLTKPERSE